MQVACLSNFNHIHRITSICTAHKTSSKAKKDKVCIHTAQNSTSNPYMALAPLQTNELLLKCFGFTPRRSRTPRCIQLQEQLPVVPRSIQQSHCRLPRRLHRQPIVLQCIQLSPMQFWCRQGGQSILHEERKRAKQWHEYFKLYTQKRWNNWQQKQFQRDNGWINSLHIPMALYSVGEVIFAF